MSETAPFAFASERDTLSTTEPETWKLFIVDDDKDIHTVTKLALKDLKFKGKHISFQSAYSAKEAIEQLKKQSDFAIVLLDIGMETSDAGLEVANFIRKQLDNNLARIIIRTGQPGDVPEREIIDKYDINDYKSKTDLTVEKLFTTIRTAIAQFDQINDLAHLNEELEDRIEKAIAKQKEQQDKLFTQNRNMQMNELLNMIAHQWRQPLSRIAAVTSQVKMSLAMDEIDPDSFNAQVSRIEEYTNELSSTIDDFRKMYEPSHRAQSVPLHDLLKKSATIISNSFKEQNISISIHADEHLLDTLVTGELYQVILNILKNAQEAFLEHTISAATIEINVTEDGDKLHIDIKDNAGGIKEDTLEHIFDPYFSTKDKKVGHGLGLHMSKNIVEQQCHGELLVKNVDQGTCFTIIIAKT
jgi:signal transduction histidine kinase